jgi:hypothetical protein
VCLVIDESLASCSHITAACSKAFTVAANSKDYDSATYFAGNASLTNPTVNLTNIMDYRHLHYYNITPRYDLGLGLTYSTYEPSNLDVKVCGAGAESTVASTNEVLLDNDAGLYDQAYKASVSIKNTGTVSAWQVSQLYVSYPDSGNDLRPVRVLREFEKTHVEAGKAKTVELPLVNKDLAVWKRRGTVGRCKQEITGFRLAFLAGIFTRQLATRCRSMQIMGKGVA